MTAGGENRARQMRTRAQDEGTSAARADHAWARTIAAASRFAETEEQVAATMDELAQQRPERAAYLRGLSEAARGQAARMRQWIDHHRDQPAHRE